MVAAINGRRLRGVFLDFDGTIAETERHGHRIAYNHAFTDLSLDWTWNEELYADLLTVAGGKERLRYYLERYRPRLPAGTLAEDLVIALYRAKVRNFARIAPSIPFRPGIKRLLREVHDAGCRVAIVTTGSQPGVEALLAQDETLPPQIDLIAANEAVERKKPAPDIYQWALDRLGLDVGECVAIEDSHIGLRSALSAGVTALVTVSDYTKKEDFSGAAAVLSDLGEPAAPASCLRGPEPKSGVVTPSYLQSLLGH